MRTSRNSSLIFQSRDPLLKSFNYKWEGWGPASLGANRAFCVLTCNLSCKSVAFFLLCVRLGSDLVLVLHTVGSQNSQQFQQSHVVLQPLP